MSDAAPQLAPADHVKALLRIIGDDPRREGLVETPWRVVEAFRTLYSGYFQDPEAVMKTFEEGACQEMVICKDIDFYSMCEHHMLPFFGSIHIGYVPGKRIIGLSKLPRLVEVFARRLQVQERMTTQIADALMEHLDPLGVIVVAEALHMCILARGVEKHRASMVTSAIRGSFEEASARAEFYALVNHPKEIR